MEPTTSVQSTQREPFWTYLTTNVANHFLFFGGIAVIVALVIGVNMFLDMRTRLANAERTAATLSVQFEHIGTSGAAVAANTTATAPAVAAQASDVFGTAVIHMMQAQDAKIQSLTTIIGQVQAHTTAASPATLPTFTPADQSVAGKLTDYPIEVSRENAPALDAVRLFYDPSQHDPTLAFSGTSFQHYKEQFTTSVGDWEQQKTGGFRTTVKLTRTVSKPNPADPTKLIEIGTETIPLETAGTIYSPQGIAGAAPLVIPRWTLNLGAGKSSTGYQSAATIDYRVTSRFGIFAGAMNNSLVGGVSIRLGANK
jgi:hypothetical protein